MGDYFAFEMEFARVIAQEFRARGGMAPVVIPRTMTTNVYTGMVIEPIVWPLTNNAGAAFAGATAARHPRQYVTLGKCLPDSNASLGRHQSDPLWAPQPRLAPKSDSLEYVIVHRQQSRCPLPAFCQPLKQS